MRASAFRGVLAVSTTLLLLVSFPVCVFPWVYEGSTVGGSKSSAVETCLPLPSARLTDAPCDILPKDLPRSCLAAVLRAGEHSACPMRNQRHAAGRLATVGERPFSMRLASLMFPPTLFGSPAAASQSAGPPEVFPQQVSGTTVRVSVSTQGVEGDRASGNPMISPDGAWVVFETLATNLVPETLPYPPGILLHHIPTGETVVASLSWAGEPADGQCWAPCITSGGRFIGFHTASRNMVAGYEGVMRSGFRYYPWQVYVRDRLNGSVVMASRNNAGDPGNDHSTDASVSDDGQFVAFISSADNLVPNDTNAQRDVFLRDVATGRTSLISVGQGGAQANGWSYSPVISANGQYVAFGSDATNLVPNDTNNRPDIFVRDVKAGRTIRVSVSSDGTQANHQCLQPSITADGRYVAFVSYASNLAGEPDGSSGDLFVRDVVAGQTYLASAVPSDYEPGEVVSGQISADGHYVVFVWMYRGVWSLFVSDWRTGESKMLGLGLAGTPPDDELVSPSVSSKGRYVAFESRASNLVIGDTNEVADVFVHECAGQVTRWALSLLSLSPAPVVSGISPNSGQSGEKVTCTVTGQNLTSFSGVTLRSPWEPPIVGRVVGAAADGTSLTVELPLLSLMGGGKWDLYVVNPAGRQAVLASAFTITGGLQGARVEADAPAEYRLRPGTNTVPIFQSLRSENPQKPTGITLVQVKTNTPIHSISIGKTGYVQQNATQAWFLVPGIAPNERVDILTQVTVPDTFFPASAASRAIGVQQQQPRVIYTTTRAFTVGLHVPFMQDIVQKVRAEMGSALIPGGMFPGDIILKRQQWDRTHNPWEPRPNWEQVQQNFETAWLLAVNEWRQEGSRDSPASVYGELCEVCVKLAERFDSLARQTGNAGEKEIYRDAVDCALNYKGAFGTYQALDNLYAPGDRVVGPLLEEWEKKISEASTRSQVGASYDPNCKAGPGGDETTAWQPPIPSPMLYYIHFENDPEKATLPAENIVITDQLSTNLDWATLTFLGGSHPQVLQEAFDRNTGTITWRMMGINLPPNKTPPEGEGYVAFRVQPKPGLPNGTRIENKASIVFDENPAMETNLTVVRIDGQPPTSAVNSITPLMGQSYMVGWGGSDGGGSGVMCYDIYVAEEDGPYRLWQGQTLNTSAAFEGQPGRVYRFVSRATDRVGNVEPAPDKPDATLEIPFDQGWLVSLDFNDDNVFDLRDLAAFIHAWRQANASQTAEVDARFDVAPWRGEIPNIESHPDGRIDYQDAKLVVQAYFKLRGAQANPTAVRKAAVPAATPSRPSALLPLLAR